MCNGVLGTHLVDSELEGGVTMGDAEEELEEATEAVRDLIDDHKLPFSRWLIKLLVEKLLVPVLVPVIVAMGTSVCGWYFIGQGAMKEQASKAAEHQVERLEEASLLVDEIVPMPRVGSLPELWGWGGGNDLGGDGVILRGVDLASIETRTVVMDADTALELARDKWVNAAPPSLDGPIDLDDVKAATEASRTIDEELRMQQQQQQQRADDFPEEYVRKHIAERLKNARAQEQLQGQHER